MDKPYVDYKYYTNNFYSAEIPEESFLKWAMKASIRVDYLTFGRISKLEASVLPDAVFDAVCSAADVMYEYDQKKQARLEASGNGAIKSESNDGYSITFADNSSKADAEDSSACMAEADDLICEYLAHTGLMFKGWSKRWDVWKGVVPE